MLKCDSHAIPEKSLREILENIISAVISKKTYSFEDKEDLLTSLESLYNCPVCSQIRNVNRNMQGISINTESVDNGIVPKLNKKSNNICIYSSFSYKIDPNSFAKIPLKISIDIPKNYQLNFYSDTFLSLSGLFMLFPFQADNKNLILLAYNVSDEYIYIPRNTLLGYLTPYYSPIIDNLNNIENKD